jgi:predicted signal transduction protein with EAL and GGDEF domain
MSTITKSVHPNDFDNYCDYVKAYMNEDFCMKIDDFCEGMEKLKDKSKIKYVEVNADREFVNDLIKYGFKFDSDYSITISY